MSKIHLPDRSIGDTEPCFIIAEAGVNHNGSLDMALRLVDIAATAKADAIKFQKRHLASLYPQELLKDHNSAEWAFQYMLPILKHTELSDDDFIVIKQYCDEKAIRFMCTPWDAHSLRFLESLGTDIYKVASADLVNLPLLQQIANTGKPMILSTGMATLQEIERTVAYLEKLKTAFALLHCVSTYPAPFESLNLRFIETLKKFGVPVGYSGHERGIAIPVLALALGASIIEKHITLDRTLPGPDHPASLEPRGIATLVRDIRNSELALGQNAKTLTAMEVLNRQVLRKSLVAAHDLAPGDVVTLDDISIIGPGKGLTPQRVNDLLGVELDRSIKAGEYFTEGDLAYTAPPTLQAETLKRPWGLKSRFHDLEKMLALQPRIIELHFSESDLDYPFTAPPSPYPQQLFIHAPEFSQQRLLDLCSRDEEQRRASIHLIQRTIDKAAELSPHFTGPVSVVIHVGGMTMDEPDRRPHSLLEQALDPFRQFKSQSPGVILLPENLPPRPWYLGGQWFQNVFIHPEEMVEFCQTLDLGMVLDISHAQLYCNAYDKSILHYVRTCLPHVRHLHIADATGIDGEGVQIGEGVVPWSEVLDLLSDTEFSWVPEIWSGHLHNAVGFIEALNRLATYNRL